uniref:Uncharacterized protein n=1 Tax=Nelumbo nucifera TaxID=4432 RepID=A0A822YT88_NELNU|nr:TPA_asm: hypothetical protein HUJ06_006350 [Nelumbo nucifera]
MRTGCHKNHTKSSWPKIVVRKWLNIKSRADEFHSDYATRGAVGTRERRKSCSDDERYVFLSCGFQGSVKLVSSVSNPRPRESPWIRTRPRLMAQFMAKERAPPCFQWMDWMVLAGP